MLLIYIFTLGKLDVLAWTGATDSAEAVILQAVEGKHPLDPVDVVPLRPDPDEVGHGRFDDGLGIAWSAGVINSSAGTSKEIVEILGGVGKADAGSSTRFAGDCTGLGGINFKMMKMEEV